MENAIRHGVTTLGVLAFALPWLIVTALALHARRQARRFVYDTKVVDKLNTKLHDVAQKDQCPFKEGTEELEPGWKTGIGGSNFSSHCSMHSIDS